MAFIELKCGIIDTWGLKAAIKVDRPVMNTHDLHVIYNGQKDIFLTFESKDDRDQAFDAIKKQIIN